MTFAHYLASRTGIPEKRKPYYARFVRQYLAFCDTRQLKTVQEDSLSSFLRWKSSQLQDWQILQAQDAVRLYLYFLDKYHEKGEEPSTSPCQNSWVEAKESMIRILRCKHRSRETEKAYMNWVETIFMFLGARAAFQAD